MKIRAGMMWDSMQSRGKFLRALGYVLIVPALLGVFVCYTCVFWVIAWNWPSLATYSLSALLLLGFLIFQIISFVDQWKQGILDVEKLVRLAGMLCSMLVGCFYVLPRVISAIA